MGMFCKLSFVLATLFIGLSAGGAPKDIITEARDAVLSGNRQKALKTLVQAVKAEKKDSGKYRELVKNLENLSTIFLTEKGQQNYELGRAVATSDPSGAILHLREALKVEPDNEAIIVSLARTYLFQGECDKALDETKANFEINPYSKDVLLVRLQAFACLQKFTEFKAALAALPAEFSAMPYVLYVEMAKAQVSFFEEKWESALSFLDKAKSLDAQFPENYYWLGQVYEKTNREDLAPYRRYVELCQEINPKRKKIYEHEPRVCSELKNIEKILESKSIKPPKSAVLKKEVPCFDI